MKGYKGFDKDLKCQGHQFVVGQEYTFDGEPKLCKCGWHFCENPLDVFAHYPPSDSHYAEIEAEGVTNEQDDDSKRVCRVLKVVVEIGISGIIAAGVKFILEQVDFTNAPATNTGDRSAATNTGNCSAATNTGNCSAATNTGNCSAATNTGVEGCAVSLGIDARARGAIGCWLTIAEWSEASGGWHRIDVQTVRVDGESIKADTFYRLRGGKFVEAQ